MTVLRCRSAKDFEEYGKLVAGKYLVAHSRSPQYKALLKTLFKAALAPLPVQVSCEHSLWYTIACLADSTGPVHYERACNMHSSAHLPLSMRGGERWVIGR